MTIPSSATPRSVGHRPVRLAAFVVGVVLTVIGVLGFIPGVTTDYDEILMAGHDSEAMLLGLFTVSYLENIVHLAFGVAGLLTARAAPSARAYLVGGGAIYAVLGLYGLFVDQYSAANFLPVNDADNWLHLGLAIAMIGLGVSLGWSDRLRHP
jgi:hypothetical protein